MSIKVLLKQRMKHKENKMDNVGIHVKNFNERVKAMNQTQSKELTLSAQDVRNLHSDIFAILAHVTELSNVFDNYNTNEIVQINVDGGGFK